MKVDYKWFVLPEYEQEEEYLRNMSNKGYELVQIKYGFQYIFKEIEPKDVVYRLDFNTENNKESYMQMYRDYGWEYIATVNDFHYFRKDACETDLDIFSDNDSRAQMALDVKNKKLMPIIYLLIINSGLFISMLSHIRESMILYLIWALLLVLNVFSIIKCLSGFNRLENLYSKQNN